MSDLYTKGFNEGHVITEHLPDLAKDISRIDSPSVYLKWFRDGRDEYVLEKAKKMRPSWLKAGWEIGRYQTTMDGHHHAHHVHFLLRHSSSPYPLISHSFHQSWSNHEPQNHFTRVHPVRRGGVLIRLDHLGAGRYLLRQNPQQDAPVPCCHLHLAVEQQLPMRGYPGGPGLSIPFPVQ